MNSLELTFSVVDDILNAYTRGRLPQAPTEYTFTTSSLGPFVELAFFRSDARLGPLFSTPWLEQGSHRGLREALQTSKDFWFGPNEQQGFLRTVFDPLKEASIPIRTRFFIAMRRAAESISNLPKETAQSLAAAIREMESNVHEHSGSSDTGILLYQASPQSFEFVVADSGAGVLQTLREAPEYSKLDDSGKAMQIALQDGASRFGAGAKRGNGFRELFVGLANLNADLRFRSGDHVLVISGPRADAKVGQLSQKASYPGFLISVRCRR